MSVYAHFWAEVGCHGSYCVVPSDIVHRTSGLFTAGFVTARRAELVLRLGVFARFVHGLFACILGDIFFVSWLDPVATKRHWLHTLHFGLVSFRFPHHQCCGLAIERIRWVGIAEKLRQEDLKNVNHVIHG